MYIYTHVQDTRRVLQKLSKSARSLSLAAATLSKDPLLISKVASRAKGGPVPTPAEKTFHGFSRLSAELRTMIWTAAVQPAPCAHYFATFNPRLAGREPGIHLMNDGGLWTACWESREIIQRAYQKASTSLVTADCSSYSGSCEMKFWRLGRFNKSGNRFKRKVQQLSRELELGVSDMGEALRRGPVLEQSPFTNAIKGFFGVEPGWTPHEHEIPLAAVKKLSADLW